MTASSQPPPDRERGSLPDVTIEAVAKSFVKEALGYGFGIGDFVRFVNLVLGVAMKQGAAAAAPPPTAATGPLEPRGELPLVGERVLVRAFGAPGDRALLERWVGDRDGRFFLLSTASGRIDSIEHLIANPGTELGMIQHEGALVGCVAYLDLDRRQRRAELRKMIGEPSQRRRGLAREATRLWLAYGAGGLGLKKVYVNTLITHIANIRLNEELGFRVEGILRSELLVDGKYRDVLRMGLWNDDG